MRNLEKTQPGILATIDQCPPFVIYYLSHRGRGTRLTVAELASDSGLAYRTFTRTARLISWRSVKLCVMDGFCKACGLTPMDPAPILDMLQEEFQSKEPFKDLEGHCRKKMMAHLNYLCTRSVLDRSSAMHQ